MELLAKIAKPRPVGTVQNLEITDYICSYLEGLGYETCKMPFSVKAWEPKESFLSIDGNKLTLHVNPYSESFSGTGRAAVARNQGELERADCEGKILFLTDDLTKESLQPKDYLFYYPDEHKAVVDCLCFKILLKKIWGYRIIVL
jgi:aminopeptidase YwaD